jgi:hypothetical protein
VITADELASRAKIKTVKDWIESAGGSKPAGEMLTLVCPYCGDLNVEGSNLCCDTLRTCIITILMGMRQERIERSEAIFGN